MIRQGDVYRVTFAGSRGSEPWGKRPAVVVQHDRFNQSRINTVVVAAITSNLRYDSLPGNVRLRKGEANLAKPCVVNVTQLHSIHRTYLGEKIGSLSHGKRREAGEGDERKHRPSFFLQILEPAGHARV